MPTSTEKVDRELTKCINRLKISLREGSINQKSYAAQFLCLMIGELINTATKEIEDFLLKNSKMCEQLGFAHSHNYNTLSDNFRKAFNKTHIGPHWLKFNQIRYKMKHNFKMIDDNIRNDFFIISLRLVELLPFFKKLRNIFVTTQPSDIKYLTFEEVLPKLFVSTFEPAITKELDSINIKLTYEKQTKNKKRNVLLPIDDQCTKIINSINSIKKEFENAKIFSKTMREKLSSILKVELENSTEADYREINNQHIEWMLDHVLDGGTELLDNRSKYDFQSLSDKEKTSLYSSLMSIIISGMYAQSIIDTLNIYNQSIKDIINPCKEDLLDIVDIMKSISHTHGYPDIRRTLETIVRFTNLISKLDKMNLLVQELKNYYLAEEKKKTLSSLKSGSDSDKEDNAERAKKPKTVSSSLSTSSTLPSEPKHISPAKLMSKHSVFHKSEQEKKSDEKRRKIKVKNDTIESKEASRKRKKGV